MYDRKPTLEDLASHLKADRSNMREEKSKEVFQQPIAKNKLLSGIEDLDPTFIKKRAALAKNRIKVEYGILSHTAPLTLGEAPLTALYRSRRGQEFKNKGRRRNAKI